VGWVFHLTIFYDDYSNDYITVRTAVEIVGYNQQYL